MKRLLLLYVISILSVFLFEAAQGQVITLKQTNKSGIYTKNQAISVFAFPVNHYGDSIHIRVLKNNQLLERRDLIIDKDSLLIYQGSFGDPCSIIVNASLIGGNSSLGMLVDPEKLHPGVYRPDDFTAYWNNLKRSLSSLPMQIKSTAVEGTEIESGFSCVNIEISCPGPKPARGYYAKPVNVSPKKLPAVLLVHAAGVKGSWCRSEPGNAMMYAKMNALCFDLNAHGMMNGQPDSYYTGLENGELKEYYLQGLTNRDELYFKGMYLRLLRAIDFLTHQPEWDGKRILVIGESQGGGQALIAAGLDKRVSAVVAIVPAMCDWMGSLKGRMGGWPQPFETNNPREDMLKTLPYFDAANILKGSKATIFTEIGMIDMTCPSTSVYAAVNQAKGKKIIYAVPYRPHHQPQDKLLSKTWEEDVYKPREQFISNFLK